MKTITKFFILGLLFFPMCTFAQKATEQRDYEIRVEWEDLLGYPEYVSYKVPIYYDDDDNVVKHGPFKINHKSDLTSRAQGNKCVITYIVSGNYVNGILDGTLSLEKSFTGSTVGLKVKGTLNFVNGEPDGTWIFTETGFGGGQKASAKLVMVIKDKKLVSCDVNNGKECFAISNNTFSGTHDGKVYKNGVNTSEFIRKTGEKTKPDETAANLINAFLAGTMSESDLIVKGFGFNRSQPWKDFDYDNISYYISKLNASHFMTEDQYTTYSLAVHEMENNNDINPALTLMRVNVKSAEEMIAIANTIKTAEKVSESSDKIYWDEKTGGGSEWYTYFYNTNRIVISGNFYYFTDEAKLKLEEAIKAELEERRLEEERLAEERRLEEERLAEERRLEEERLAEERRLEEERLAEERRLQEIERIQPICDYLVLGKTALSICYGEQRGNYFDPTGLSSTWELDLEKAIKPFCKIVDCKLISYDATTGETVLEITKFVSKKKGSIIYRVPVVIVNNKVLVKSIDFSKATIVE